VIQNSYFVCAFETIGGQIVESKTINIFVALKIPETYVFCDDFAALFS
jgi:hypothetical protein